MGILGCTMNPALKAIHPQHHIGHLTEGHHSNKGEQKCGDLRMSELKEDFLCLDLEVKEG